MKALRNGSMTSRPRAAVNIRGLFLAATMMMVVGAASSSEDWLPPAFEQGAAQQLVVRLVEAGFQAPSEEQQLGGAVTAIRSMRRYIDELGVDGLLSIVPRFPELSLPAASDELRDGILRINLCNLVLFLQHEERSERDENARVTAAMGLSAVLLATMNFRHHFVQGGGDPGAFEALLTGEKAAESFDVVQSDVMAREHVEQECTPLIVSFVESATRN